MSKKTEQAVVKALLDAAFGELQHDTGPQDIEYVSQRKNLKAKFRKILLSSAHAKSKGKRNNKDKKRRFKMSPNEINGGA